MVRRGLVLEMATLDLGSNLKGLFKDHRKHSKLPQFFDDSGKRVETIDKCSFIELLDSLVYPKGISTPFKSKRGSGDNYTLESIVNCLLNSSFSYTEYMQECRKVGCPAVSLVDRKDLIAYLTGEKGTCEFLDESSLPPIPFRSIEEAVKKQRMLVQPADDQSAPVAMELEPESIAKQLALIEKKIPFRPGISKKSYSFVLGIVKEIAKKEATSSHSASVKAPLKSGTKSSILDNIKANAESMNIKDPSAKHSIVAKPSQQALPVQTSIPIIVVPASFTSLINMFNVKSFLEDESFVTPQEARARGPVRKEIRLRIVDKQSGNQFCVIDNVNRLKIEDWENVIAVFVQGESWQFKGWKWESPVELFSHVKGYWLKYEDENPVCEAKNWNVEVLNISKSKRHLDSTAVVKFWHSLNNFVERRRRV